MDLVKTAGEIFLAYDIRGIFEKTINREVTERIAGAVAQYPYSTLCIGYDGRFSSPSLQDAFFEGLKRYGGNLRITSIGMAPTPVVYFTTWKEGYDLGVAITASHNPPEFNGFKFVKKDGYSFSDLQGLKEKFLSLKERKGNPEFFYDNNALKKYSDFLNYKFSDLSLFGKTVVTESFYGATSLLFPWFFKKFGAESIPLHAEVRGDFGGLKPEPDASTISFLSEKVKEEGAVGIGFDGDGDRSVFVDENGRMLSSAKASVLFSRQTLENHPGSKILANVECSSLIKKEVEERGGELIWTPVGHTIMEEIMKKEKAMLAVEPSHHYYFADIFPFSDGIVSALKLFQIIENGSLASLANTIEDYPMQRIGFSFSTHKEKDEKMKSLEERLKKDYKCNLMDGIKIFLTDSDWVLIRKSNTEPKIRLTAEAKTKSDLEKILKDFSDIVKSV